MLSCYIELWEDDVTAWAPGLVLVQHSGQCGGIYATMYRSEEDLNNVQYRQKYST